jgi:hypothetical protein
MLRYNSLIQKYPTSEELFAFLRSDEGGRIQIRETAMRPDFPLAVLYYDKKKSDMANPSVGFFRSVIWDTVKNRPVCVGPARGSKFSAAVAGPIHVQDFIDGVMINMFYYNGAWHLATRTQIGAENSFYGRRPYASLFWEAFAALGLTLDSLDTTATYSWVLQHPEERIVVAPEFGIPKLYLIKSEDSALKVPRPVTHDLDTLEKIKDRVQLWGRKFGAQWQGLIFYDKNGTRYKIRSDAYEEARHLRGNQPKREYLWLERWTEGRLPAYTRLYPEEEHQATAIVEQFKTCTKEFYEVYGSVYKEKKFPLKAAPQKYRKLLWEARQAGVGGYFPALRDFMNKQDVARKLWLVNYEARYPGEEVEVAAA